LEETQEGLTLKRKDVRFTGSKPHCPKCKSESEVIIINVTLGYFECRRCSLKFSFSD